MLEAATRLSPAIEGIKWLKCGIDGPPEQPILSVTELKLIVGANVQDDEQPGGVLWKATLAYLQQLPGIKSIYWGLGVEDSNSLCLLIQWGSVADWKNFQGSLGVMMMTGLLVEKRPYNHSLRVHWPDWIAEKLKNLEIICAVFSARSPAEERHSFEENWCDLMKYLDTEGEILPSGWIERHAPIGRPRTAKYQCPIFLGFVSQSSPIPPGCASLAERLVAEFSADDDIHISQNTYSFQKDRYQPDRVQSQIPSTNDFSAMPSTAWLIDIFPHRPDSKGRKGIIDLFNAKMNKGLEKSAKISKKYETGAKFGPGRLIGPQGAYLRMGDDEVIFGQEHLTAEKVCWHPNSVVDIFWLEFDPKIVHTEGAIKTLFQEIDAKLKARMINYPGMRNSRPRNIKWYTDTESYTRLFLLVRK